MQLLDEIVHRLAGLHHQHHPARRFEQADQFLDGVGADDLRALGLVGEEIVHLGDGAVVDRHGEAVVVHVQNQVLAHHGQADQADVRLGFHCFSFLAAVASSSASN